ncbi:C25 family cysteine peptidase [Desulfurobacterium sp.]
MAKLRILALSLVAAINLSASGIHYGDVKWINLGGGDDPSQAVEVTPSFTYSDITFDVSIDGFYAQSVEIEGVNYQRIFLPGGGHSAKVGYPEVPSIGRWFVVPHGADVTVDWTVIEADTLHDFMLFPAQPQQVDDPDAPKKEFVVEKKFYNQDTEYPQAFAKVSGSQIIRGVEVRNVLIMPFRYNPLKKELIVVRRAMVHVTIFGGGQLYDPRLRSPFFEPFFADFLANYGLMADDAPLNRSLRGLNTGISVENVYMPENAADLLIIVPDDLYDSIIPLALHHIRQGMITKVVTLSQIGSSTAEGIREYIRTAYNSWEIPPSFVLIVGDADMVPTFYKHVHPYENIHTAADVYYGEMDIIGQDSIPMVDVFNGRISVDDAQQLGIVVHKIIKYEEDPATPYDWLNSMLLAAYNESGRYFVYTSEAIYNYLNPLGYNIDRQYEDGNPPGSTSGVLNAINNGVWLVNHRDHGDSRNAGGSFDGWAHPRLTTEHMSQLTNGDYTPVVFSLNCRTGWFDGETDENSGSYECIAEEFVRTPNAGAVAALGLSRVSYSGYNDEIDRGLIDALFPGFDPNYPNDTTTNQYETPLPYIGGVINYAKLWMYDKYYLPGGTNPYPWTPDHEKTLVEFEEFTLIGDPAMRVRTAIPDSFMVNYPLSVNIGPSSVSITVMDQNGQPMSGALVGLTQCDTVVLARGITDENGVVMLDIFTSSADPITITVTGYNRLPFTGSIQPISEGAYVGYRGFVLDDTTSGNGNGVINPDELVHINILARNFGNDTAYSVTATLTTEDSFVTITQNTSNYGDIAPDDSLYGDQPFAFTVAHNTPDMHSILFDVSFTDANDSTWTSRFSARVYAPELHFSNAWVFDTLNGNGNHVGEPGETLEIMIGVRNAGHEPLDSVQATISTDAPYLHILENQTYIGYVDSMGVATSVSPVVIEVDSSAPAPAFPTINIDLIGAGDFTYHDSMILVIGQVGIMEAFEDSTAELWTHSGSNDAWHLSSRRAHSGMYSYFFGTDNGNYPDRADAYLVSPMIILGDNPELSFWTYYSTETNYDYCTVEISTDSGSTWNQLAQFTGSSNGWVRMAYPIEGANPGDIAFVRFHFHSDGSVNREGWYIDDVIVTPPEPPAQLTLDDMIVVDTVGNGNGLIEPGETVELTPVLTNIGGQGTSILTAIFRIESQYITVVDSMTTMDPIGPDSTRETPTPFVIQVASSTPTGTQVTATIYVHDDMGFEQELPYSFVIGDERLIPSGPDSYGYYAFDVYDQGGFEFNWIEVDPQSGGSGTRLNLGDDETVQLTLPFSFTFYGQSYTIISVCSNGWIAMGQTSSHSYSNRGIPNSSEPNNMIAGYWDDLNPRSGGSIAYGYDSLKHVFVVEWNGVPHFGSNSDTETFEILLFDPVYYTTPTGDGPIVVQYKTEPTQTDYTVGIENENGSIGLQYYYDGTIDPHGFPIADSFTLHFTTSLTAISENGDLNRPITLELAPASPNPAFNSTNIRFALPSRMDISLDIYDITGRHITTLAKGTYKAGYYTVRWDGSDKNGKRLPAGLYIYMLKTGSRTLTRKLVLLK